MKKIKRIALALVKIWVVLYIAFIVFLYCAQRELVFPGVWTQGSPAAKITPPDKSGEILALTTTSGVPIGAYWAPPSPGSKPTGRTILYFYGNGLCLNQSWYAIGPLRDLGCAVMSVDYPGFGTSGGEATDKGCYEAADAAYDYLTTQKHVAPDRIISAGWSLGSGVAVHLASERRVGGLMTFSAYTTMAEMCSHRYKVVPLLLARALLKYPFPSIDTIANVHCPIFIAHGGSDPFIPPSMAHRLAAAAGGPATVDIVPFADHTDLQSNGGAALYGPVRAWIDRLPPPAAGG